MSLGLSTHHGGPWTETDYFALGERGDRIELIDGGLLITPTGSGGQRRYARALANLLDDAAPGGFEVLGAVNVRVGRDRVLIPDIVVTNRLDEEITFFDAADIALVVEIASPSNATTDRVLKSHLYAAAGIETYLRVELGEHGPVLYEHRLAGSAYALVAEGGADNPLALVRPYPVEIDPGQLLRRR